MCAVCIISCTFACVGSMREERSERSSLVHEQCAGNATAPGSTSVRQSAVIPHHNHLHLTAATQCRGPRYILHSCCKTRSSSLPASRSVHTGHATVQHGGAAHVVGIPDPKPTAAGRNLKLGNLIVHLLTSGEICPQTVSASPPYSSMAMAMAAEPGTDLETLRLGLFGRDAEMQAVPCVCTPHPTAPVSIPQCQ